MTEDTPVQSPTDIAGVGIHLSYIRRDMQKITATLDQITSNYVPITVHLSYKTEMDEKIKHLEKENESRKEFQDTLTGKLWGIGIMAGGIVGIISFLANHYFK